MIGKRTMATSSSLFLMLLGLGVFFATYNLVTMLIHHQRQESGRELLGGDPVTRMPVELRRAVLSRRPFHVAVTATDAPYSRWQCRIMYYWYKEMKEKEGSEMGGFTRVLHSGEPDSLMDEIPTFVVNPLPNGADRGYIVLNRPWAFVQWLEKATIEEEYILMAEPDHIFVKPLPNLAREDYPAAFPFFYIKPNEHVQIIRKYFPDEKGPVTNIDPIGNSPVIIKKTKLQKIAPTWMNVSLSMKEDPVTDKAFGWVLEMYAYAIASALHGVQHILRKDFMIQPPWDLKLGNTFIIHFTYGCDYSLKGELTYGKIGEWRFDKRSYLSGPPPRNLPLPPPGVPESVDARYFVVETVWLEEHVNWKSRQKEQTKEHGLARLRNSLNLLGIRNTFSFKEIFFVLAILHLGHYYTTLRNSKKRIPNDLDSSSYKTGENSRDEDKVTLVKMVNEATANIPGWDDGR